MAAAGDILPLDFICQVFRSLPDVTLAGAAQACRAWSSVATEEYLARWQRRWTCGGQQLLTNSPELSPPQAYGHRHKVDCAALALLQDMAWPERRANALQQFRRWGADVLDVLLLASRCQGPGCLSLQFWAQYVLGQVKTKLAAAELQQLPSIVHQAGTPCGDHHQAVLQAALCIAAVHQPSTDMHAVLHVLDQLAAEAHERLARAAAEKAARTQASQRSARPSMNAAAMSGGHMMTSPDAGNVLQDSSSCVLTAREALEVINQLLFGPADPHVLQQHVSQQQQQQQQDCQQEQRAPPAMFSLSATASEQFSIVDAPPPLHVDMPTDDWGMGLQGNRDDFYAASNSLLPDVLVTGKGIPITLAIIHMAVCQRVGLDVQLVNMPMRVINCLFATRSTAAPDTGSQNDSPSSAHDNAPAGPEAHFQLAAPHCAAPQCARADTGQQQLKGGRPEVCVPASTAASLLHQPSSWGGLGWSAHARPGSQSPSTACTMQRGSRQVPGSLGGSSQASVLSVTPLAITPSEEDIYVDVFTGGQLMDDLGLTCLMRHMGIHLPPSRLQPLSPKQVAARMCANLCNVYHARREPAAQRLRMMLELATAVTPEARDLWAQRLHTALMVKDYDDAYACLAGICATQVAPSLAELGSVALQRTQLEQHVDGLQSADSSICTTVKTRAGHTPLHFYVGQLVRHTQLGYRGVVYSWDPNCNANSNWVLQMDVEALPGGGAQQPFYCVLVDERDRQLSRTYVAQCNLEAMQAPQGAHTTAHVSESTIGAQAGSSTAAGVLNEPASMSLPADADAARATGAGHEHSAATAHATSSQTSLLFIQHADLGKYFTGYDAVKGCFVPNASLRARYPDDSSAMGWGDSNSLERALQQYLLDTMSSE